MHDSRPSSPPEPEQLLDIAVDGFLPPSRVVVRVRGELDMATAPALQTRLTELVERGRVRLDLDLDLGDVPFCDVAGLNALIAVHGVTTARGGRLVIHRPCRSLRRMLELLDGAHPLRTPGR